MGGYLPNTSLSEESPAHIRQWRVSASTEEKQSFPTTPHSDIASSNYIGVRGREVCGTNAWIVTIKTETGSIQVHQRPWQLGCHAGKRKTEREDGADSMRL